MYSTRLRFDVCPRPYLLCVLEVLEVFEVLGLLTFPGVLGLLEVLGCFAYFRMESVG